MDYCYGKRPFNSGLIRLKTDSSHFGYLILNFGRLSALAEVCAVLRTF